MGQTISVKDEATILGFTALKTLVPRTIARRSYVT